MGAFHRRISFWQAMGRLALLLLFAAGACSGGFLLLSALGVIQPDQAAQWVRSRTGAETQAAAPVSAPVQTERAAPPPFHAVFVSDPARAEAEGAGCDGVVLDLKPDDGALGYVSALPLAADCAASAGTPGLNDALTEMNRTPGLYTVARISCFRDETLCRARPDLALRRVSGSPWTDEEAVGWLDPDSDAVKDYLLGVCRELAGLGFDEILLSNCCYPTRGSLAQLEEQTGRASALETFCRAVQEALAPQGVKVSIQGEPDAASPSSRSGQTAGLLSSFSGRVWLPQDSGGVAAVFASQSPVLLRTSPGPSDESWAVWGEEK